MVAVFRHGRTGHYIRMPTYKFQEPRSGRHDQHFSLTPDVQVRKDIPVRPRHTPLPVRGEHGDVLTFLDGDGSAAHFVDNGNGKQIPGKIQFPGYNEKWKRAVAKDNGEILKVVK